MEGHRTSFPEAKTVENAIQKWLNDSPNVSIEHVAQTPIVQDVGGSVVTSYVLVTIFYRD